jgi:hypothetical protein
MISDKGEKVMTEIRTTYLFTIALTLDEIQLLGKTPLNRGEKADPSELSRCTVFRKSEKYDWPARPINFVNADEQTMLLFGHKTTVDVASREPHWGQIDRFALFARYCEESLACGARRRNTRI